MPIPFKKAELIAKQRLLFETLTPRNCDRLDFHEVSVRSLYEALNDAYNLGLQAGIKKAKVAELADATDSKSVAL